MKKKKIRWLILLVLTAIFLTVVFLFNGVDLKKLLMENLSEYRTVLFVGESESYLACVSSGYREEPYSYDGVANELTAFGIINIKAKKGSIDAASYRFVVLDKEYVGQFEYNPYDSTLIVDTAQKIENDDTVQLFVTVNGKTEEIEVTNRSKNWGIDPEKALEIASKFYEDKLNALVSLKSLLGEVFFKIALDSSFTFTNNYYYVCICDRAGNTFACIIDVNSGSIMASN